MKFSIILKKQYKLLIGERTAENIKIKIGTVAPESEKGRYGNQGP